MEYRKALARDSKLKRILKTEVVYPKKTKSVSMSLVTSILSQQLSIKVAKVMKLRFLELYGGRVPTAQEILDTPNETIKGIGISQSKANYIHNVAGFIIDNKLTLAKLQKLSDEEVIELLTQIKGVGRWTVEMLLIFGLGREDVFAVDDLGIQKGMIGIFQLQDLSKKELRLRMQELSKRWSPYRSFVCLHLWNFQGFE
ncbi:MAG TPA: hypothetical protein VNJ01_09995 [Bacteriovoracaceae bacterium]|nr:hypothetical protein [Bacteriovoracaceae bacterium]